MSDEKKRTRFSAVFEELTSSIKPMTKPAPGTEARSSIPQLFEGTISCPFGRPAPCPKCNCTAFEPVWVNQGTSGPVMLAGPAVGYEPRLICRACPRPSAEIYMYDTSVVLVVQVMRCGGCGCKSRNTITIGQTNLYCGDCGKLTLHETFNSRASIRIEKVNTPGMQSWLDSEKWPPDRTQEACARCGHGRVRHRPECQWNSTCGCPAFCVSIPGDSDLVDSYTIAMANDNLTRAVLAPSGSYTSQLAESFYDKLGWKSSDVYARGVRELNNSRGMTGREIDRRTGRTTRGLLYAFAEVEVRKAAVLWLRGATKMSDALLVAQSEKLRRLLRQPLSVIIKKMPENLDPKRCSADVVYIDHHYYEVLSSTSDRSGRFQF